MGLSTRKEALSSKTEEVNVGLVKIIKKRVNELKESITKGQIFYME